jgi:cytochrome c553
MRPITICRLCGEPRIHLVEQRRWCCLPCQAAKARAHYQANRARVLEQKRDYRARSLDAIRSKARAYQAKRRAAEKLAKEAAIR